MKVTDYCPRAAFMDTFIKGGIGIEVGCDVGAHAEALLVYKNIAHLTVVDLWENEWCEGYCKGRLSKFGNVLFLKNSSHGASKVGGIYDFIYIDISHDSETVKESLKDWWPLLKVGGVMGYRNYTTCKKEIDKFIVDKKHEISSYHNEIVIWKEK